MTKIDCEEVFGKLSTNNVIEAIKCAIKVIKKVAEINYVSQDAQIYGLEQAIKRVEEAEIFKKVAREMCDGYLDMPSGCEGCPLFDEDKLDVDGNCHCELSVMDRLS